MAILLLWLGENLYLTPWLSDRGQNALTWMLKAVGLEANTYSSPFIELGDYSFDRVKVAAQKLKTAGKPTAKQLANEVEDTLLEKYDRLLPGELRKAGFGASMFDVDEAWDWVLAYTR